MNRLQPSFSDQPEAQLRAQADAAAGTPLGPFLANLADLGALAEQERAALAGLEARIAGASVVRVPLLLGDVHDLDGLRAVAAHLAAG